MYGISCREDKGRWRSVFTKHGCVYTGRLRLYSETRNVRVVCSEINLPCEGLHFLVPDSQGQPFFTHVSLASATGGWQFFREEFWRLCHKNCVDHVLCQLSISWIIKLFKSLFYEKLVILTTVYFRDFIKDIFQDIISPYMFSIGDIYYVIRGWYVVCMKPRKMWGQVITICYSSYWSRRACHCCPQYRIIGPELVNVHTHNNRLNKN